jgi:hypothetical protein
MRHSRDRIHFVREKPVMRIPKAVLILSLASVTIAGCATSVVPGARVQQPLERAWTAADSLSAQAAATRFLAAFDSLQWERFTSFFAENVTVFLPFPDAPARVDGRAAAETVFSNFFATVREGGRATLGIMPRDLRVQLAGADFFSRSGGAEWIHADYHQASDEVERVDADMAARIGRLLLHFSRDIADADTRPRWEPASFARIVGPPE